MKLLVLNLPNPNSIVRRFICSMNAPDFLLPPLELSYLAAVAEKTPGCTVEFIDAIAARMGNEEVRARINESKPDIVATILGYEHIGEDIDVINALFGGDGRTKILAMGALATSFADDVLKISRVDIVMRNEPEMTFKELLERFDNGEFRNIETIKGITYSKEGKTVSNPERERIGNPDILPFPARHFWDIDAYSEPFFPKRFTTIQTGRGCPYPCTFCTRTYGREYAHRGVPNIIAEIKECIEKYGIRNFRIIDDTFPISKKHTIELCQAFIDNKLGINWVCLTRINLMDEERLSIMKKAGCRRLYIGIESGSDKILELYKKGFQKDEILPAIKRARKIGLEVVGYFVIGLMSEDEEDFRQTIEIARESNLDLMTCARMAPYPGTEIFVSRRNDIEFSLNPFVCRFKDRDYEKNMEQKVRTFYKKVYLTPSFIFHSIKWYLKYPVASVKGTITLFRYMFGGFRQRARDELI